MRIDPKIWNTLVLCTAQKNDVRVYLRGIFCDFKNKRLASTDGHRLFVQNNIECVECVDSVILNVDNSFKAPTTIDEIEFDEMEIDVLGVTRVQINYIKNGEVLVSRYAQTLNGKFPDIDRVLPKEVNLKPTDVVGINPEYIADVSKSLKIGNKPMAMKLQTYGNDSFGIDFVPYKDIQYVVMAVRV